MSTARSRISKLLLSLLFLVLCAGVLLYRQDIYDWWQLRSYVAPQEIASIAQSDAMTEKARRIFYVARPVIEDSSEFNQHCGNTAAPKSNEKTIVLGCYDGRNIYVFNVTDQRLQGVKEVTSAHEMLHAAYERLSGKERDRVNAMLNQQFKDMNDQRITDVLAEYKKSEPTELLNEMHSIFGTELDKLNPDLEAYYGQYFSDRSKVVGFALKYESVFTQSKAQIATIDVRLTDLGAQINRGKEDLDIQRMALSDERSKLERMRNTSDAVSYNQQVDAFNAKIESYNQQVAVLQQKIAEYNGLVEKRNTLAAAANDLAKSLDSKITPISE